MNEKPHIGQKVTKLYRQLDRLISNEVAQYGITNIQARIILFIYFESSQRQIYQKDIEERFDIRSSSVTSVLKLMESNGYLERISVAEDGRLKQIILLDKGIELQKSVYNSILKVEEKLSLALTKEEYDLFNTVIDKLYLQIVT